MDQRKVYAGFDGGGSTSRFIISRKEGEQESYAYPINLKYSDIGIDESARLLSRYLREILGKDSTSLASMCISISGGGDAARNLQYGDSLRAELNLPELRLRVEADSRFALETAYPGDSSGMLLIAGTGSVALAKIEDGDTVRVGGWGRLLGDEGSGYWIGLEVLKSYCTSLDLEETNGELFRLIRKQLSTELGLDLTTLRDKLFSGELRPQDFAPLAFACAENDDDANDILMLGADLLATDVNVLWDKVEGECEPILKLHGSIANQPPIFEYIQDTCEEFGVTCEPLDGNSILERTLVVARGL